jgi:hypothetical protein
MNSFYVHGISREGYGTGIMHLLRTPNGWKQRVVDGDPNFKDCLNKEYVNNETEDELKSWLKCDLTNIKSEDEY